MLRGNVQNKNSSLINLPPAKETKAAAIMNPAGSSNSDLDSLLNINNRQSTALLVANPTKKTNNKLKIPCLYTKQLNKKRKAFSDGFLIILTGENYMIVTLIDAEDVREIGLESRQLEPAEISLFQKKISHKLSMENYLVEVIFEVSENKSIAVQPPLKLPKFVPPRTIKPSCQSTTEPKIDSQVNRGSNQYGAYSAYKVIDSELDDIWGTSSTDKMEQNLPQTVSNVHKIYEKGILAARDTQTAQKRVDMCSKTQGQLIEDKLSCVTINNSIVLETSPPSSNERRKVHSSDFTPIFSGLHSRDYDDNIPSVEKSVNTKSYKLDVSIWDD